MIFIQLLVISRLPYKRETLLVIIIRTTLPQPSTLPAHKYAARNTTGKYRFTAIQLFFVTI